MQFYECFGYCSIFGAAVALNVYLALYTFNNPDPQAYYVEGTDTSAPTLVAVADLTDDAVVPIHDKFVSWFTLMLINMCATFGMGVMMPMVMYMRYLSPSCGRWFAIFAFFVFSTSWIVTLILGLIIRFGKAGSFSSGGNSDAVDDELDALYQVHSAKFLSRFYLFIVMAAGGVFLCTALSAVCRRRKQIKEESYDDHIYFDKEHELN